MSKNQLLVTAYIFDNTGNVYLRTEEMVIPLPALFIKSNDPIGDTLVKSKILYGPDYTEIAYVEETIDELNALLQGDQVDGEWLLATGIWDDSGIWDDTAIWND